jgi:hypothetical protein
MSGFAVREQDVHADSSIIVVAEFQDAAID